MLKVSTFRILFLMRFPLSFYEWFKANTLPLNFDKRAHELGIHFLTLNNNLGQKKLTAYVIMKFISFHTSALLSVSFLKVQNVLPYSARVITFTTVCHRMRTKYPRMAVLYSVQSQLYLWYTVICSCLYGLDTPVPIILQICNIVLCQTCMEKMGSAYNIWLENLKGKDHFKN